MILDPIILSGPHVGHREIECAAEAAGTGWNSRASEYVLRLQQVMAGHARQRHALAVSSGRAAMHLALLGLRVGVDDEVLIPEIAPPYIAAAILHVGARPVFCDVDPETLCISPGSVENRVTRRSRCMVAAHLYGQMCDTEALSALARKHNIPLVEYATGGFGANWKGRPAGSVGIFSIFSFEGYNPVVAGGGAVLLGSNKQYMERAAMFAAPPNQESVLLGFDYGMSNLQASVGCAQMERLDEIIAKKLEIFDWYKSRLEGIDAVALQAELPECRNSRLMTVLHLKDPAIEREAFVKQLREARIMAAEVQRPLSSMAAFEKGENPSAYGAGQRALLLPCGYNRTVEEVEYICETIKRLVSGKKQQKPVELSGWLKFKSDTLELIAKIKQEGLDIPFEHKGRQYALRALLGKDALKPQMLSFLTLMREQNKDALLSDLGSTEESTKRIMARYETQARDFLLFLIVEGDTIWGHIGLERFDFKERNCKVEALMMREDAPQGLAAEANLKLHDWARDEMQMTRLYTHVVGSNKKSRILGSFLGYKVVNSISLYKDTVPAGSLYRPMYIMGKDQHDETFVLAVKDL